MALSGRDPALRCSFCGRGQDTVAKLISNPSDRPRSYICNECVDICRSIIEDDQRDREPDVQTLTEQDRFAQHPLASDFLTAAERWAVRDLAGSPAMHELDELRSLAARMLASPVPVTEERTP